MNEAEKVVVLNAFIQRMKNLKDVQKITGENPIGCRLTEKEIKQLIYLLDDYLFLIKSKGR